MTAAASAAVSVSVPRRPRHQRIRFDSGLQSVVLVSAALLLCLQSTDAFLAPQTRQHQALHRRITNGDAAARDVDLRNQNAGAGAPCRRRQQEAGHEQTALTMATDNKSSGSSNGSSGDSWSKAPPSRKGGSKDRSGGRNESRFGVRSRVKSVLAKARNRTGITNSSELASKSKSKTKNREREYSLSGQPSSMRGGRGLPSSSSSVASTSSVIRERSSGGGSLRRRIKTTMTAADVVADAASIGGLGAVVVDDMGTVDVALDFKPTASSPSVKSMTKAAAVAKDGMAAGSSSPNSDVGGSGVAQPKQSVNASTTTAPAQKITTQTKKKKTSPASTYSDPITPPPKANPEDSLVPAKIKRVSPETKQDGSTIEDAADKGVTKKVTVSASVASRSMSEVDAFKGDVSAAFSMPPPPLPFTLPTLDRTQQRQLDNGERVQFQNDMGREGSGFVVLDVKAPPDVVWDCLLDFYSYPETIPTVRDVTMYTNTHLSTDLYSERPVEYEDGTMATLKHGVPSVTRAAFTLSKFKLKIAAIHKYRPHPLGDYMVFTLDPACTNMVLKAAKGVWHTQSNPDGKGEEYTRVWLLCEVKVSRLLPKWITDYAARRAMPRATTWLKPQVETANALWLKRDE